MVTRVNSGEYFGTANVNTRRRGRSSSRYSPHVFDILTIAPVDKYELATDTRVDLDPHHLAGWRRKKPLAGGVRIEPGVEDAFGRRRETVGDA